MRSAKSGLGTASRLPASEATALWPVSKLVDAWYSFAGASPFADLREVRRFTDRKTATARIASKHGYTVASIRQETDKARCYSIEK